MVQKWADYAITAIQYEYYGRNGEWKRIVAVEVREDQVTRLGNPKTWLRQQVVNAKVNDQKTFVTSILDKDTNKWLLGAKVEVVLINGIHYIRTDRNNTPADNLGNLPELQPIRH